MIACTLALFFIIASATSMLAQPSLDTSDCPRPTLVGHYKLTDYIRALPDMRARFTPLDSLPEDEEVDPRDRYRNFTGLLIEENLVKELYPLLLSVFFDSASATFPERYVIFTDPSQSNRFTDTTIPGGTLEKYYQVLNIVGFRMRDHPRTRITLVGYTTGEKGSSETMEVAKARADTVAGYLKRIWGIDPARIRITARMTARRTDDPLLPMEQRCVMIQSTDWEIARPIVNINFRRYPQPDTMGFEMTNGISDDQVLRREIVIQRNGKTWHVMKNLGTTERWSPSYSWGKGDDPDSIPTDESPYQCQLVVYNKNGTECWSEVIEIPVEIVTNEEKRREKLVDQTIDVYNVVLFDLFSSKSTPLHSRTIRDYVVPALYERGAVTFTGYTDAIEAHLQSDGGIKLSEARAKSCAALMDAALRKRGYTVAAKGLGGYAPLYPNDLPEGRMYNRTVQIRIVTPTGAEP